MVRGWPLTVRLPEYCRNDCTDGFIEGFEQFVFRLAAITELQVAVPDVTCTGDLCANVIVQVSREMQDEAADAISIRKRTLPDLFT